jgi:hypothetical protein
VVVSKIKYMDGEPLWVNCNFFKNGKKTEVSLAKKIGNYNHTDRNEEELTC